MTQFQTTAQQIALLADSKASLVKFDADAQNPEVIAQAKAAHEARAGGFDQGHARPIHGRDGFERSSP